MGFNLLTDKGINAHIEFDPALPIKGSHVVLDFHNGDFVCEHCGERYAMAMPAPMDIYCAAMRAFGKSHRRCKLSPGYAVVRLFRAFKRWLELRPGVLAPSEWMRGDDTGISSKTIWRVMMEARTLSDSNDVPHDPDDFGRCHRLLERFPKWRARLGEVAAIFPAWAPLVREWNALTVLYLHERPGGACPLLYARMQTLLAQAAREGAR